MNIEPTLDNSNEIDETPKDVQKESIEEIDSGNEDEVDEESLQEISIPIIVEEESEHLVEDDEEDEEEEEEQPWLPLPGSLPPDVSEQFKPVSPRRRSFLRPINGRHSPISELPELDLPESPDMNYSLQGDQDEDRKYYIYKVRDVNMVPKKECVGKVVIPGNRDEKKPRKHASVTLEELRQLIRNSSDEALQDAAKQRFRYLSESYHLVAMDESFTPVDQIYPTQGVFIKLDSDHPFSKPRVDNSLTARLQAEYERRFGPIVPKRPRKPTYRPNKWDELSRSKSTMDDKKSIFDEPIPFNTQSIKEQFERQLQMGSRGRRNRRRQSLSKFRYDSFDYVNGQYRDTMKRSNVRSDRSNEWNSSEQQQHPQRKRNVKGQRPPWRF